MIAGADNSNMNEDHDIVWVLDTDLERIESINGNFSGVSREKILTEGTSAIWPTFEIESLEKLLETAKRIVAGEMGAEELCTQHTNLSTRQVEYYHNMIELIPDADGGASLIRIVSRNVPANMIAPGIEQILGSISAEINLEHSDTNLLDTVGRRLQREGIGIFVMRSLDGKTTKMTYTNIPMKKLQKIFALMGKERAFKEIPISMWRGVMAGAAEPEAEYWDDLYSVFLSRLHDLSLKKNFDSVSDIIGRKKVIIVPICSEGHVVGSFVMMSDALKKKNTGSVSTFAHLFSRELLGLT